MAHNTVKSILQDTEGNLWFGTGGGTSQYDNGTLVSYTTEDGLGNNLVMSILQDREGQFWFATLGGVVRFDGQSFTTFTTDDGLPHNEVRHILQDRDGALWFSTLGGVSRFDGQTFTNYSTRDGLAHDVVRAALQDWDAAVWFINWEAHAISRFDGKIWTTLGPEDGLLDSSPWSIFQDRAGKIWISSFEGVSRYDPASGGPFTTYTTRDGLANNEVRNILQDRDGRFWFATFDGLSHYDGDTFITYTTKDGLAHNELRSLLQDRAGNLWVGTYGGGVSRLNRDPDGSWHIAQTLNRDDGLAGNQVVSLLQDRAGDLWFGTLTGVTRFSPTAPTPPPIFVKAVVADRRYVTPSQLNIPSSVRLTAFEFQGLSFKTRSEAMVYRYRLKGYADDWKTTRVGGVEYQDLPVGQFTFEVQAIDRDLVFSTVPARVSLTVHLPYERMMWGTLLVIAVGLIVWQTGRAIRRDRRLWHSNTELRQEMIRRERAELEREKLDARLEQLQYLYTLRSTLLEIQTPEEAVLQTGETLMGVLSDVWSAGVQVELNGQAWEFGVPDRDDLIAYQQVIRWGDRDRGVLCLFCSVPLTEAQKGTLVDETAGQLGRVLEAKELEAQLLQSARLVSLGEMAAGVAHELNQPLSVISTLAGGIRYRLLNGPELELDQMQDRLQKVLEVVERMGKTIDHLRVFSRDTSEETGTPFAINEVVRNSLGMIGRQLKNHNIELVEDLQNDLPEVLGQAHQMEQVVLNLLANARDAVNELGRDQRNGKQVWVRSLQGDGRVIVEVEDNGVGISERDQERLFDPFFTTKEAEHGTGLGLAISYAIVKNHGGEILCTSTLGIGSVFWVALPT